MGDGSNSKDDSFIVLINAEEQHSIWPAAQAVPAGWSVVSEPCSKAECLALVESRWTDMRPKSLRAATDK